MKFFLIQMFYLLAASKISTSREDILAPTLSSKILAVKQSFMNLIANAIAHYH